MEVYRSREYVLARARLLKERPICEVCGNKPSEQAHHVVPLHRGGEPFKLDNLEALCAFCHRLEHSGSTSKP